MADVAVTDLHTDALGFPWGQTRVWSNGPGYAAGSDNGSGWVDTYTPHLLQADGTDSNTLVFIANGTTAYYYDLVNGSYQPRIDDGSKLTYSSANDTFGDRHRKGKRLRRRKGKRTSRVRGVTCPSWASPSSLSSTP